MASIVLYNLTLYVGNKILPCRSSEVLIKLAFFVAMFHFNIILPYTRKLTYTKTLNNYYKNRLRHHNITVSLYLAANLIHVHFFSCSYDRIEALLSQTIVMSAP